MGGEGEEWEERGGEGEEEGEEECTYIPSSSKYMSLSFPSHSHSTHYSLTHLNKSHSLQSLHSPQVHSRRIIKDHKHTRTLVGPQYLVYGVAMS